MMHLQSSQRPRSYQSETSAAISRQVVRLFAAFWESPRLSHSKGLKMGRLRGYNMSELFILSVMKSQEAIILHEVLDAPILKS